ncbi:hypothetical protein F5883DRAFT_629534 [Diaporthe sp. PMI_573]|nr:hypothetical protein F5883DRAFT_629534 [Diaporthaceae sp. PMI_573]
MFGSGIMHDIDRDLDTDGDVLLILQRPNSPFAVWSEDDDLERPGPQWPEAKALDDYLLKFRPLDRAFNPCDLRSDVKFRLSSKHLKSASPVFKTMLNSKWKESTLTSDLCYTVDASDWDTEALQIIIDIIYGRSRRVPRSITLELLFFSDIWIENLQTWEYRSPQLCRDLILRLCISYIFNQAPTIYEILYFVVREACGPL